MRAPDKEAIIAGAGLAGLACARRLQEAGVPFLRRRDFSKRIIQRFFKPFSAGVCLDPDIEASSRVSNIYSQ